MRWGRAIDKESGWQPWFAWHPVQLITGEWVWLERVERIDWFLNRKITPEEKRGPLGFTYAYRTTGGNGHG